MNKYDAVFVDYESWYIVIVTDPFVKIMCALRITGVFSVDFRLLGQVEANNCFWQMTLCRNTASISYRNNLQISAAADFHPVLSSNSRTNTIKSCSLPQLKYRN